MQNKTSAAFVPLHHVARELSDDFIEKLNLCLVRMPRTKINWFTQRLRGQLDAGEWEPLAQLKALAPITGLPRAEYVDLVRRVDAREPVSIPTPDLRLTTTTGGK